MISAMADTEPRRMTALIAVGVAAVALTMLLAGIGLVTAIRQAQVIAAQRVADLQSEALLLKENINNQALSRLEILLERAAQNLNRGRTVDPFAGIVAPEWVDETYIFDRDWHLKTWRRNADGTLRRTSAQSGRQSQAELFEVVVTGRLVAPMLAAPFTARPESVQFVYDIVAEEPVVVAYLINAQDIRSHMIVGAHIDLAAFKAELVDSKLPEQRIGIRMVLPVAEHDAKAKFAWTEDLRPLAPPFWLVPTKDFASLQESVVKRQVFLFIVATVLAVVALIVVVWVMWRVLKREIALSKMKQAFVADVSHELKTPLALIRLFGESLSSGRVPTEEKRQEYYEIITRESTRLTHLINNILDFARIDASKKRYTLVRADIANLIRETYEAYQVQLDHDGFEHQLVIADDLPEIYCDPDAVSQAVINLINNAMKYTDPQDKFLGIDLSRETRRGRHGVLISVSDRGIGIKPEDRNHLFTGFYRADDERVRKRRGAGLGLALVKHIVDAHNGLVDVESRLVKGSTFRIFLPTNTDMMAAEVADDAQNPDS